MGYKRALRAVNLEETDRIPSAELIANPEFEQYITGINPYQNPLKAKLKMIEKLDIDLCGGLGSELILNKPKKSYLGKENLSL